MNLLAHPLLPALLAMAAAATPPRAALGLLLAALAVLRVLDVRRVLARALLGLCLALGLGLARLGLLLLLAFALLGGGLPAASAAAALWVRISSRVRRVPSRDSWSSGIAPRFPLRRWRCQAFSRFSASR